MVLKDAIEILTDYEEDSVDIFLDSCSVTHFNFINNSNPGWANVFRPVQRILKPGGFFIVSSDIRFDKERIGEFILPETIVKTAEDSGLILTSKLEYNRKDAIIRNQPGYGILGVANFCFRKA